MRAYFYENNFVSFYQFGVEDLGYTRYLPYQKTSTNSHPTSCLLQDYPGICHLLYSNSRCASDAFPNYPVYDARCRSWYILGKEEQDPHFAYFQYPRIASNGEFVLTGVVPIRRNNTLPGHFYGVLNSNYLISTLSNAINDLTILDSGYCYLIDATNVTNIILHPNLPTSCSQVQCAEGFSDADYTIFYDSILQSIEANPSQSITTTYSKGGDTWRLVTYPVKYGSVSYALLVTVPDSQVLQATDDTQNSINSTVVAMIVVFVIAIALFLISFYVFTRMLVREIVQPIDHLREILRRIKEGDYTTEIPKKATSYDLEILLEALSNLIVALRFGSDSYARGNPALAEQVFQEALIVFSITSNQRGIGACYNNLAAVELSKGNMTKAEEYNQKAIENAQALLSAIESKSSSSGTSPELEAEKKRLMRLLSDRKGNLVVTYLEQNNFSVAFSLLEKLLEEDKEGFYIKGCVVKQGTLGQYYLKQQEITSAEKIFLSALQFIEQSEQSLSQSQKETNSKGKEWNFEELMVSKQIAHYNMTLLMEAKEKKILESRIEREEAKKAALEKILHYYLYALVIVPIMHTNTVKKILMTLKLYFHSHCSQNKAYAMAERQLDQLAERYNFQLATSDGKGGMTSTLPKRIAFAIDYSGSMSGMKIRSARENLEMIVEKHTSPRDSICLVTFTQEVQVKLPLIEKAGNESTIELTISNLTSPMGSTALYDAVNRCITLLQPFRSLTTGTNDWIVALTDGEDNSSVLKIEQLIEKLQSSSIGVIVVGVGGDVQTELLTRIAKASKKGEYVYAKGDKKSIDEAFGQVAQIIQSQIIMEDII